jgi:hypothetical protein
MVNRIPDATGWISENGPDPARIVDPHWAIELLAILAIMACVAILARLSNRDGRPGHCHFCGREIDGGRVGECEDCAAITSV